MQKRRAQLAFQAAEEGVPGQTCCASTRLPTRAVPSETRRAGCAGSEADSADALVDALAPSAGAIVQPGCPSTQAQASNPTRHHTRVYGRARR